MLLFVFSIFAGKKLEPIKSITTIDSILQKLKIEKNLQKKIELHFLATEIYSLDTKFYSKCYFHLNQVKNLIQYVKDNERKANFLLKVGTYFMLISDNSIAISYINSALLVVNGLKIEDKVLCFNKLGILYSDSNEEKKAIDSYNKGISLILKSNKKNGVLFETLYNNIAISYMDSKLLDSAMYYLKTCLKLRLKRNDFLDIGQSYNNIGSVLFFQEKYDSSLFYFKKGYTFRINSKKAPESSICEIEINISKALIGLNKFREAEILLKKTMQIHLNSFIQVLA
jgi:tetratricopeptide (TPR) repeat protein